MITSDPANTFRGLPLSSEQDSEIRHYIHARERHGLPWNTTELEAMIADMLHPPEMGEDDREALSESMGTERASAVSDGGKDLYSADPSPES